jgi:predicted nucleic acid-binding protein
VLLDSSAVIALKNNADRNHAKAVKAISSLSLAPDISVITLSEVLIHESKASPATARLAAARLLEAFRVVHPVSAAVAILAAEIRAKRDLGLADSMISATALLEEAELWTCDKALANAHQGPTRALA